MQRVKSARMERCAEDAAGVVMLVVDVVMLISSCGFEILWFSFRDHIFALKREDIKLYVRIIRA